MQLRNMPTSSRLRAGVDAPLLSRLGLVVADAIGHQLPQVVSGQQRLSYLYWVY